ncbi:hypothetical protein EMCRGX_G013583 [Ephydatia muelleri]
MTLHVQGFFSGAVPCPWLQEQDLFVGPNCQQLVANPHHSSRLQKCSHASATFPIQSFLPVKEVDPPVPVPTFDSVCKLPRCTVRHIPVKDRLAFALALCSALSVEAAITSLCLSVIYAPNDPKASSVHYGIEHPNIISLVPIPPLTTYLQQSRQQSLLLGKDSSLKACQHLIEAAEVPLQFPIFAVLRDVVNLLISGKVPVQVARFLVGGNPVALEKNKPN